MISHCPAVGLDPRIIPAESDAPLGFQPKRLEFLTGFTTDSIPIINPQPKFAITNWVETKLLKVEFSHPFRIDNAPSFIIINRPGSPR